MAGGRVAGMADVLVSATTGLHPRFGQDGVWCLSGRLDVLVASRSSRAVRSARRRAAAVAGGYRWGVFAVWTGDRALTIGWTVLLVSAIALAIGWHSRLAALTVFVLILSFEHRNLWVFNSGDLAVRIEALFLALSPCGAALSLDQRRSAGTFWSAQQRAQWPVRLMQAQLTLIYLASVLAKLNGDAWPQGTAVSYALRLPDMLLLPFPPGLATNALLMNFATWVTLLVELSIGTPGVEQPISAMGAGCRCRDAHRDHDDHHRRIFHVGHVRLVLGVRPARRRAAVSVWCATPRDEAAGALG